MRLRLVLSICFCIHVLDNHKSFGQDIQDNITCDKNGSKIDFSGKAPKIWSIDGSTRDWETIFGPFTGNNGFPYHPPITSAFNWAHDFGKFANNTDFNPPPSADLKFLGFTHDDYNVYFYFRMLNTGMENKTFFLFCDIDADELMAEGEPVFSATLNNNTISAISVSTYEPDHAAENYVNPYGNLLTAGSDIHFDEHGFMNGFDTKVNTQPGRLKNLFHLDADSKKHHLKKNEVFKASVTENGFGVEFSIPWRLLKNYSKKPLHLRRTKKPLQPGEVFFYKLALMDGAGSYDPEKVQDNMGNCCNGPGRSQNVLFKNLGVKTTVLTPKNKFKFQLKYKNETNAAIVYSLEEIAMENEAIVDAPASSFIVKVYPDFNCNGRQDADERHVIYNPHLEFPSKSFLYAPISYDESGAPQLDGGVMTISDAYSTGCLVVEVTYPTDGSVLSSSLEFIVASAFNTTIESCCDGCGGKPINPVGVSTTKISLTSSASLSILDTTVNVNDERRENVKIYPNPSSGIVRIKNISGEPMSSIIIQDVAGRIVSRTNNPGPTYYVKLSAGVYVVKVIKNSSAQPVVKKIIVY